MIEIPIARPSSDYEEAIDRVRAVAARDDDRVRENAHTAWFDHGKRTAWSVVLFHGLTNHPGQFVELAPQIHALGHNVFVPRMRYHGYRDRMSTEIAALTADDIVAATYEAVDIAAGLGERVALLGISMGGLQCAFAAQTREDVAVSVPVGPDFGLLQLPRGVTVTLSSILRTLPNLFLWWDPRIKEAQRPKTAYPRFSTHALMQTLRVGDDVYTRAKREAPRAQRIAIVTNRVDPAVNNEVTKEVVERWRCTRNDGIEYHELTGLPSNHDIIDPDNPLAQTATVYPKLIEILALA